MSQSFYGAEPKVVKNKTKYNQESGAPSYYPPEEAMDDDTNLNIMHDKRVFRGNTYNMNLLKQQ